MIGAETALYVAEVRAWLRQARWRYWRRFRPALYQQKLVCLV